jgi:uridine kinase
MLSTLHKINNVDFCKETFLINKIAFNFCEIRKLKRHIKYRQEDYDKYLSKFVKNNNIIKLI